LVPGAADGKVRLWDAATGENIRTSDGHTDIVTCISWSKDGNFFVTGGVDGTVHRWTPHDRLPRALTPYLVRGPRIIDSQEGLGTVSDVSYSPCGTDVAITTFGYPDGLVSLIWNLGITDLNDDDITDMADVNLVSENLGPTYAYDFDGDLNGDSVIDIVDLATVMGRRSGEVLPTWEWRDEEARKLKVLPQPSGGYSHRSNYSPDGETLAVGAGQYITLWDVATGMSPLTLWAREPEEESIVSISYAPDGNTLATGSENGTALLWDVSQKLVPSPTYPNSFDFLNQVYDPSQVPTVQHYPVSKHYWDSQGPQPSRKQITVALIITGGKFISGYEAELEFDSLALRYVESANGDFLPEDTFVVPPSVNGNRLKLAAAASQPTALWPRGVVLATITFEVRTPLRGTVKLSEVRLARGRVCRALVEPEVPSQDIILNNPAGDRDAVWTDLEALDPDSLLTLKSTKPSADDQTIIIFRNDTQANITSHWLDYEGNEVFYRKIPAGTFFVQDTFVGHIWVIKDVNAENLAVFRAEEKTGLALVTPKGGRKLAKWDVNRDSVVDIRDLVVLSTHFGKTEVGHPADVNGDGVIDIRDLILVAGALGEEAAAAPPLQLSAVEGLTAAAVQDMLTQARQLARTDPAYLRGIAVLEQLLARLLPKETLLLANYPNPFNPETWIPYQLAESAEVTVRIYDARGLLVHALPLGHQAAGVYQSKSRAAYWDGKNAQGEPVASGVYFYTLTAGDFTATRKMLIRK